MSAFDPAAWVRRFEAAGGSHLVTTEARVSICYPLRGDEEREQDCCRLLTELSAYPEHKAAVRQYLIGRP